MRMRIKAALVGAGLILGSLSIWAFTHSWHTTGPVDRKIVSAIKSNCARRRPCTFFLDANIGSFKWDTLYVFTDQMRQRDVEQVLQIHIGSFREFSQGMAFMDHGKLVHFEQEYMDFEKPTPNSLNFEMSDGQFYRSYSPDTLFSVGEERIGVLDVSYSLREWPCKPVSNDREGKVCPLPE